MFNCPPISLLLRPPATKPNTSTSRGVKAILTSHGRVLLVLRRHSDARWDVWESRLGPFIHSATVGQIDKYPQLTPLAELQDGRVFEVGC